MGKQATANPSLRGGDEAILLLRSFEESGQGWFWSTDEAGRITYLTDNIAKIISDDARSPLGSLFTDHFVLPDGEAASSRTLPFIMAKRSSFEKITLTSANPDDERWWVVSGAPQFDKTGAFKGYRGSGVDITEQRRASEHASQLAMYDPLTGLPNRLRMAKALEASLVALEHHKRPCAVLLIDLDRFKQVNDTLGHPAGDALLKQVSERLLRIVGDREKIFRLGGDEFQIIMPDCEDRGIIGALASDIISSLSQPYSVEGSRCNIGASIGVAVAPADGQTREELTRNVDLALYAAKTDGRGRFRFFSSDLLEVAEDRRLLEEDLRDALAKGEIRLFYQPIVNARSNCVTGVEALIRWHHPVRGPVSPALFIPIAEEANLIAPLGEWVLRKACEDAANWPGKLRVAVNVSPIQFTSEMLPKIVMSALAASGLPASRLELELTEGIFLSESAETDGMFETLKGIGVRLALDDFGTGYSSLGYLKTAPFDKIKIDQSFVRGATVAGSRNGAIIAAIVALANALEMETTAEGIESLDQLDLIRNLGVSHVQGYVYSKAVDNDELSERLETGDWVIPPSGPAKQRSDRQSVYRKAGAIVGGYYHPVLIRNLSETGALVEALPEVPIDSQIIMDFGDGQLVAATVRRATKGQHGIEFGSPLVSDGNGGLCTSHRISPYLLGTLGLSTSGHASSHPLAGGAHGLTLEQLAGRIGLSLAAAPRPSFAWQDIGILAAGRHAVADGRIIPTVEQFAQRYLDHLRGHGRTREIHQSYLQDHILPKFGRFRLNEIARSDISTWLAAARERGGDGPNTAARLHGILGYMFTMAGRWGVPGAEFNPVQHLSLSASDGGRDRALTTEEMNRLRKAVHASHNSQLKHIVALLLLTNLRVSELLGACWDDINLDMRVWRVQRGDGAAAQINLSAAVIDVIGQLPRWDDCPYVIANPRTKKPYRSFFSSWDAARRKAGLPHVSIHDLRHSNAKSW
ncbi:EAL domain-containing protein [Sphingomonas sp. DBB INV C78]|uniref:EAL domain-containing protein n=1 Tax=Sphingomonas sp. DBB INV C78 TaxID=3349434 RepID=UPI0036D22C1C